MAPIAFGLRADYDGTVERDGEEVPVFSGGLIRAGNRDFDVRAELDNGDGRIVVDESDYALVNALDGYPALKRVSVEEDAELTASAYPDRTVTELRAEAQRRGLEVESGARKPELVSALEADDRRIAGEQDTSDADTNDDAQEA